MSDKIESEITFAEAQEHIIAAMRLLPADSAANGHLLEALDALADLEEGG